MFQATGPASPPPAHVRAGLYGNFNPGLGTRWGKGCVQKLYPRPDILG